jgi:hypothetical protein
MSPGIVRIRSASNDVVRLEPQIDWRESPMRRILLLGIALILAACGDVVDPPATPTPTTIAGSYHLTSVDGESLPFLLIDLGAYQARLVSGTLAMNADGSYVLDFGLRIDDSGRVRTGTDSDSGAWIIVRDSIALTSTAGNITKIGTLSGTVMTLRASGNVLVLKK